LITIPEHKEDFEMRILLSRHVRNLDNTSNRRKISYKLFWYEGYQIIYPIDPLRTLQNLSREIASDVFIFEASNVTEQYVLVILNSGDLDHEGENAFSLDIYSFLDLDIKEIPKIETINKLKLMDNWHPLKEGGNLTSPNFVYNPQFRFNVKYTSHIQLRLETTIPNPIMICIIENASHVSNLPFNIVMNSKNQQFFFNSFSYLECCLMPGDYNIICVPKEERFIGRFNFEVNLVRKNNESLNTINLNSFSVEKLTLQSYPFCEVLKGEWDCKNNKGFSNNSLVTMKNPGFVFLFNNNTKFKFILRPIRKITNQIEFANSSLTSVIIFRLDDEKDYTMVFNGEFQTSSSWGFFSEYCLLI
jgi:hypothetical protein